MIIGTTTTSDNIQRSQTLDEKAAAATLSQLNHLPAAERSKIITASPCGNGNNSDSDSAPSGDESVFCLPKTVHKPPVNSTMVDHTYKDYSVVGEEILSYLNTPYEDSDGDSEISEEDKKMKEKAMIKIKKIFGDISPTRKNSGGVVKPFPEKVR
jgi:hypothetical protein